MRIRRLEISGFKSFADRAVVVFGEGITGVVGPNGCGKSNVVDAIRWCMGEMSAKQLRGRAMHDVIFAGCESRGPLGMAEVTLTMQNDGNVPPQYAAFEEIAVTRRLHRDGTSEYLINRVPVRLRDVTDLFLGTGVGTRAYSIIEQGRIGFIVSSRPEDRRSVIEEVAGITKFKARKKAAERRLEATEQNLARVNDIVVELERQLVSLRRQARKAERYKELRAEQRDLDLHAATFEMLRLVAVEKMQRGERATLEGRLDDTTAALGAAEGGLEAERLELTADERALSDRQQESAAHDLELAGVERDLGHWREQLAAAQSRAADAKLDVETAARRAEQAVTQRAELETLVRELGQAIADDQARLTAMAETAGALHGAAAEAQRELEELRRQALEHVHGSAQQRGLLQTLTRQRTDVQARVAALDEERQALGRRQAASQARRGELEVQRRQAADQLVEWTARVAALRAELERVAEQDTLSEARVLALRGELSERRSRWESLVAIARRLEGYADGVRTLWQTDGATPTPAVGGLLALVSDVLEAPPELERAIEAVLGEALQVVIVEEQTAAIAAIDYLKQRRGGRSAFLARAPRRVPVAAPLPAGPGVVGTALAKVKVAPEYRELAEALLGDVVIVDRLDNALALWRGGELRHTLVTLDGEVCAPNGVLAGGSDDGMGLLAKRREIRELEEAVAALERELAQAQAAHQALEQARLQLDVDIQQLEKDIHSSEIEQVQHAKDLEATDAELGRLAERLEVVGYELEQLGVELATLDRDHAEAAVRAASAESRQREVEQSIQSRQAAAQQRQQELEQRADEITNLRVLLASREEKLSSARETITRLAADEVELRARIERGTGAIADGEGEIDGLRQRLATAEVRVQGLVGAAAERHAALSAARAAYEAKRQALEAKERGLRDKRAAVDQVKEAVVQVKLDLQRLEMERQRLSEQVFERHDVALERIMGDYHLRALPDEAHVARQAEVERAIKNIGPINLTAIDECAEIEKRYSFLATQRDDLQQAVDALKRAIQRINRASRERFAEAFAAVNEMFQKVFPRLFRGGEARLELSDSDDLLEAGVEIIAQPPGKRLQSVGLLSGGEKALTATALVFSIFLIKPSPFCVLDEVDAPLDDANVGRFNDMLRDISRISQFIVITHNKLTMAEADRLYGITMEEPGLSKVVSVDLTTAASVAA